MSKQIFLILCAKCGAILGKTDRENTTGYLCELCGEARDIAERQAAALADPNVSKT